MEIDYEYIGWMAGEFHVEWVEDDDERGIPNSIRMADDYVHYAHSYVPAKRKMNVSLSGNGDIYEVEMKYADDDDFLIVWKGPIKNEW